MSTQSVPSRYQPSERVVDNRDRLRELYCQRGLTIREIASEYAEVGRSRVCDAIHDHDLVDETDAPTSDSNKKNTDNAEETSANLSLDKRTTDRGTDPPSWTDVA